MKNIALYHAKNIKKSEKEKKSGNKTLKYIKPINNVASCIKHKNNFHIEKQSEIIKQVKNNYNFFQNHS